MKTLKLGIIALLVAFFLGHQAGTINPELTPVAKAQTPSSKSNLISKYRAVSRKLLDVMAEEQALRTEYDAVGFGDILADEDFIGSNAGITKTQFTSMVSSFGSIRTTFTTGHITNIAKVAP